MKALRVTVQLAIGGQMGRALLPELILGAIAVALPLTEAHAATHWAFQPVRNPPLPSVRNTTWPRNGVDLFVLAKLEAANIHPAPLADNRTLIRRATYDLTGLPPTFEEVEAFVAD